MRPKKALLVDRLGFEKLIDYDGGYAIRWAVGRGYTTFDFECVDFRNGEEVARFREDDRAFAPLARPVKPVERVVEKRVEVLPSVEKLAKALWNTDKRVIKFVGDKSEAAHAKGGDGLRWNRVEQVAWERDEGGWRTESMHRAKEMLMPVGGLIGLDGKPTDSGSETPPTSTIPTEEKSNG